MTLTKADKGSWLATVWAALEDYADYTEDGAVYDKEHHEKKWDEINTAMSWVTEELGLEYNEDGDYVDAR
jgi:hypothetical protein